MHKIRFIRITDLHDRASVHDTIPVLEVRDTLLRMELGDDPIDGSAPKVLSCVPVTLQGQHYEPSFCLKGSDPFGHTLVNLWADFAEASGINHEKIISARSTANAMQNYPNKKPD